MDYKIIPQRANRCDNCGKIIRSYNKSGLCSYCNNDKRKMEKKND